MLDSRVYRLAFVPALVALFVAAFALENRPPPERSLLPADGFNADRAYGTGARPERNSLRELAAAFPSRRAGSPADDALGDRVAQELGLRGFHVTRRTAPADTAEGRVELQTVVGVRPGPSSRQIVVLAHRDALGAPAVAALSGTAALLELARVSEVRDFRHTLVVVSTSGGSGGSAGARTWAREWADRDLVDAVLVLGDLASVQPRKPWVVPWSNDEAPAAHGLRRTVEQAVRTEVGADPGGARAPAQWLRRAVPLTVSEQGEVLAAGAPAVLLSATGERGPAADAPVVVERLDEFGRAALRALSAVDGALSGESDAAPAFSGETDGIVTVRKVLPTWIVAMLVLTLLGPAALAALDGVFRARRRGLTVAPWVRWTVAGSLPVVAAWAWARLLDVVGLFDVPGAPAPAGAIPLAAAGAAAVTTTVLAGAAAWWGVRRLRGRLVRGYGNPASGVGAVAIGVVLSALALVTWALNPYAAALLVPAAHLWLLAAAPGSRLGRGPGVAVAVLGGLALPALAALYYGRALGMDVLDLAWLGFLAAAGGNLGLGAAVAVGLFAACLAALAAVLRARRWLAPPVPRLPVPILRTRGPAGHAGPGSLGGTKSALRR